MNSVLSDRQNTQYLEIGVYRGESFVEIAASRRVGVDPMPMVPNALITASDVIAAEPSDAFFEHASDFGVAEGSCDVVLIDGLHEFEQALRDVFNAARVVKANGVIVLDDCNPKTAPAEADHHIRGAWNGDVWKVMDLVRRTQPQWRAITIDADNGIGLIWGFDRPALAVSSEEISRTKALSFSDLEADRGGTLGLVQPAYLPPDFPGAPALSKR